MESRPRTILVVDDEPAVRRVLRRCFETEAYAVREAGNGTEALEALAANDVDLITLDLNLGGEDGLEVARRVRASGSDVAIVMVSGKGDLIDTVVGLEVGADDYIAKPFELREVLARVRSVLRRTGARGAAAAAPDAPPRPEAEDRDGPAAAGPAADGALYRFAGCALDVPARELRDADGAPLELTTAEFELLHLFVRTGRQALTRDRIMDELRGADWHPNDRTVDNHVARLRRKLENVGVERVIRTVRGIGYQFTASVERD